MAGNGILRDMGGSGKDGPEHPSNPARAFSRGNLKKQRGAFLTCLIAALLLIALAAAGAVYLNAVSVSRFETALLKTVDVRALQTDEESVRDFARETVSYLTGGQEGWNPQIMVAGVPASGFIPQSFRDHMHTVRGWFLSARAVFMAGAAIVLALLGKAVAGSKSGKSGFSAGGYYGGALLALLAIAGLGLWAYVDFDGFWAWLHEALIPDGIFSAAEPIMALFPLELFANYLAPVAKTFGIATAATLALPLALVPLSRLLAAANGKAGVSGAGRSASARRGRAK